MAKEHLYRIVFNSKRKYERKYVFNFGVVKNITLSIAENAAELSFSMKTAKTFDDFISFSVSPFKNAYAKVHMLHALLYGKGIVINFMDIYIDNQCKRVDSSNENFPLLFSMLENKNLSITDSWQNIAEIYSKSNKTIISEDTRFAAMYSYLLSKTRTYEYDRFQNLWTAINACYTFNAKCFEASLRKKFEISEESTLKPAFVLAGNDGKSIGALSFIMGGNYRIIDKNISASLRRSYLDAERWIGKIQENEIDGFYEACVKDNYEGDNVSYYKIKEIVDVFEVSVLAFMTLGYPYYWRCKYFHGNYISPLFVAYNDDELNTLKVLNYFMDKFLIDEIPAMFEKNYWADKKYEAVIGMYKKCYPQEHKKYLDGKIVKDN